MRVHIRARVTRVPIPRESRTQILTALRKSHAARETLQAVRGTFETWSSENKPHVTTRDVHVGAPVASQGSVTLAIDIYSDIWEWLDAGYWRHVRMSNTFVPKTRPRSLLSGPGGGYRNPIGTQIPPIWVEARDWSGQLRDFAQAALAEDAEQILRSILRDSGLDQWTR